MATPTATAAVRPAHRTARVAENAFSAALALDFANGQVITTGAGSSAASTVFDATNDRVVMVSTDVLAWITVGVSPVAVTAGAGNLVIPAAVVAQPIYVPAGMAIAAIGATAHVSCIPALLGTGQ
jgi:hypothetical protein